MDRHRPPYVAQGTWQGGALHVWGWNGLDSASSAWLYGGFGRSRWTGADNVWMASPAVYGTLSSVRLPLPSGSVMAAPSIVLTAPAAELWLADARDAIGDADDPAGISPSLAWSARLIALARTHVASGHLRPVLVHEQHLHVARWRRVEQPVLDATLQALATSVPPVCLLAESDSDVTTLLDTLVDRVARAHLHELRWRPDLGRKRDPALQASRMVATALGTPDAGLRSLSSTTSGPLADEVARIERLLDRHGRRLDGAPALRPRLRLTLPDDALDPWVITLELVDEADAGRWCSAADVWESTPLALDLVHDARHLDVLREMVLEAAELVSSAAPGLDVLRGVPTPCGVELDLHTAADFLDIAPHELARRDVELIGPEHLVRAKVSVRGRATPAPGDDRKQQFGREALVEWQAVIDDTPLSDADLARAEAAGQALLHIGHRWVRIDPAGLRRARELLDEQRDEHATVDPLTLLRLAAGEAGDDAVAVAIDSPDTPDTPEMAEERSRAERASWVERLLTGLPDERLEEASEPEGFVGELRHYQRRGLAWMQLLARLGLGGCLADDMGLGKTATALAHLVTRPGPHLVICPLSVVHNWEAESARFAPGLRVTVHHGAARQREAGGELPRGAHDLVLTTYGLLTRDLDTLAAAPWTTVVLDEAQMVKNPGTKAARAVRRLQAGQKLALTGTPVENRLSELWALLDAVNPGSLGSQAAFRRAFASPIEREHDVEATERLRRLTRPFVLRRTKADRTLLPELPDKIEQIAYAQLTKEQAVLYQHVVDQLLEAAAQPPSMRRRGQVLAALTRLKQICNHPAHALKDGSRLAGRSGKLHRFDEIVTELLDVGERALVFTQFREMGDLLQTHVLEQFGFQAPFLHGGVARARRTSMVARFQGGEGPPLLLVSLKAGGTGLNLTAARHVIHYDRWWNPAVEDQATDRAWRLGQHQTVHVHKLVCQGTVEERIGQVIDDKRLLADAVIGGEGEAWLSELSTEQLRELVVLDPGIVR